MPVGTLAGIGLMSTTVLFNGLFTSVLITNSFSPVWKLRFNAAEVKLTCVAPDGALICCNGFKLLINTPPVAVSSTTSVNRMLSSCAFWLKSNAFIAF